MISTFGKGSGWIGDSNGTILFAVSQILTSQGHISWNIETNPQFYHTVPDPGPGPPGWYLRNLTILHVDLTLMRRDQRANHGHWTKLLVYSLPICMTRNRQALATSPTMTDLASAQRTPRVRLKSTFQTSKMIAMVARSTYCSTITTPQTYGAACHNYLIAWSYTTLYIY